MQSARDSWTLRLIGGVAAASLGTVRSLALAMLMVACTGGTDTDPDTDTEAVSDSDIDTEAPIDQDQDGFVQADDCDDLNSDVNPGADEVCNGLDDNCDDIIDNDATDGFAVYADVDEDGYGDAAAEQLVCEAPQGTVDNGDDCDDTDPAIHPAAREVCDLADVDEDCDELADDADPSVDVATMGIWYADADADGFGDPDLDTVACDAPAGFVADDTDCGDDDATANPDLGCPGPWDGVWEGTLVVGVVAPSLGLSDQCTAEANLQIEAAADPQLDVVGGTPLTCEGEAANGPVWISGDFVDEDTVDATLTVDGEEFEMTIELSAPGEMSASGSDTRVVSGVAVTLSHDLSATRP